MVGGAKVQVRSALTAVNRKRNYSLKTAESLVKQHLPKTAELTEIDWKARTVTVWTDKEKEAKDIKFTQTPNELGGKFSSNCGALKLP